MYSFDDVSNEIWDGEKCFVSMMREDNGFEIMRKQLGGYNGSLNLTIKIPDFIVIATIQDFDSGLPIQGIKVSVENTNYSILTNSNGKATFYMSDVARGSVTFHYQDPTLTYMFGDSLFSVQ